MEVESTILQFFPSNGRNILCLNERNCLEVLFVGSFGKPETSFRYLVISFRGQGWSNLVLPTWTAGLFCGSSQVCVDNLLCLTVKTFSTCNAWSSSLFFCSFVGKKGFSSWLSVQGGLQPEEVSKFQRILLCAQYFLPLYIKVWCHTVFNYMA